MNLFGRLALFFCLFMTVQASYAEDTLALPTTEIVVKTYDGNELPLYQYPANGRDLILWIGGNGWHDRTTQLAQDFAQQGIEVWQIDFAEALLQTSSSNFMRNLDARYVADVIDTAHKRTGKRVIMLAQAYGSIPVLRGATLWQQREKHYGQLLGAILFSPDLLTGLPPLGKKPEYLPISRAVDIPLIIYQGGLRGSVSNFYDLLKELTNNNPNIFFSIMPGIAGVFYREEPNQLTLDKLKAFPLEMPRLISLLANTPYAYSNYHYVQPSKVVTTSLDSKLTPFKANFLPPSLKLNDSNGHAFNIQDYRGKVTVVNFWATWCPPCVAEIPSLNRLKEQMKGENFELISINYAETPQVVNEFMQRVDVEFPVLLDLTGKAAQEWKVIGFPSTFVIGKDGKIQFGVNAAIHWDEAEIIKKLKKMSQ